MLKAPPNTAASLAKGEHWPLFAGVRSLDRERHRESIEIYLRLSEESPNLVWRRSEDLPNGLEAHASPKDFAETG